MIGDSILDADEHRWRVESARPAGPPDRPISAFGKYQRVEHTPIELKDLREECHLCGDIGGPGYRTTRHTDLVVFGATISTTLDSPTGEGSDIAPDAEWVGAGTVECLVCSSRDPVAVELDLVEGGHLIHGTVDYDPQMMHQYREAYAEWKAARCERLLDEIDEVEDLKRRIRAEAGEVEHQSKLSLKFGRLNRALSEIEEHMDALDRPGATYEHPDTVEKRLREKQSVPESHSDE